MFVAAESYYFLGNPLWTSVPKDDNPNPLFKVGDAFGFLIPWNLMFICFCVIIMKSQKKCRFWLYYKENLFFCKNILPIA